MRRLATALLPMLVAACGGTAATASSVPATAPTRLFPIPADALPGTLVRVIDGDSLEIDMQGIVDEVRLEGVNTPEGDECWGDEARAITSSIVAGADLSVVPLGRDRYDRLLAEVWAGDELLGYDLLTRGAALALSVDHDHLDEYLHAEAQAYAQRIGMWASDACGPASGALVSIDDAVFDAPGRDDVDPNGEWVEIANDGPPVDLSGWTLRDESSTHRFTFPPGITLDSGDRLTIHSGCGDPAASALFWCEGAVWSNGGDTAILLDSHGNVVDRYRR